MEIFLLTKFYKMIFNRFISLLKLLFSKTYYDVFGIYNVISFQVHFLATFISNMLFHLEEACMN